MEPKMEFMNQVTPASQLYIGLMSGTSMDGVDAVLVDLTQAHQVKLCASVQLEFSAPLRELAMSLQSAGANEIMREAELANQLARVYADAVHALLQQVAAQGVTRQAIRAIGVHGQTIRHRPELGMTRQTNNPALLAELTNIDVIADFRSRDIAAGGQGAPLVPAFHRAVFGAEQQTRVLVNIGGMSNISILHADGSTLGFDTGPGNVLMDAWIQQHQAQSFDRDGAWGAQGNVQHALVNAWMNDPYFALPAPKSTGRDLFDLNWLQQRLVSHGYVPAHDVQATLHSFTARSIAKAIADYGDATEFVYVCGGGAYNAYLMRLLKQELFSQFGREIPLENTAHLGVQAEHVEALAFAWLAQQFVERKTGNLPAVTGAKGGRILGALYPA
jgi:anhydro-N-acetylmuramic acid kinase